MFVSKMDFLIDYYDWLFSLIMPLLNQFIQEDVTDNPKRNRTIGYLIEILFGYWCKDYNKCLISKIYV